MKILPKTAGFSGLQGLKVLILVTGLALAMSTWYVFFHQYHDNSHVTWFPSAASCDVHAHPCSVALGSGRQLTFHIDINGPIEAHAALPLEVDIQGIPAHQVNVDLVDRYRDSRIERFVLDAITPSRFRGQGQVDKEVQTATPWRARVILETPEGDMGSWFDFEVVKKS
ncbi:MULTISPECIES: hypothetical protein [Halomonas]|uniref:hypothetical protein n=1 Tax=Halomonas TaxID=2745 RepID=UPI000EEF832C|nr:MULTISPECIES: hypothetical protein [Halomonas]HCR98404.1 hypothetical protein [Halomonas sp.]